MLPVETVCSAENASLLDVEASSTSPKTDDESRGDYDRLTQKKEQVAVNGECSHRSRNLSQF